MPSATVISKAVPDLRAVFITFRMPQNMTVQSPNTGIVAGNAKNNVCVSRYSDSVSPHRVHQVPRRFVFTELPPSPTNDLESLTWMDDGR